MNYSGKMKRLDQRQLRKYGMEYARMARDCTRPKTNTQSDTVHTIYTFCHSIMMQNAIMTQKIPISENKIQSQFTAVSMAVSVLYRDVLLLLSPMVGSAHVNPRFQSTTVRWNLKSTQRYRISPNICAGHGGRK